MSRAAYKRWRIAARWLIVAGAMACAVALALLMAHVKTVLVSGPIILAVGIATLIAGIASRNVLAGLVGAAHVGICLFFFLLVRFLDWTPREAHQPFTVLGVLYTITILPLSVRAWVRPPLPSPPDGTCEQCGYLLQGLPEPRCPECGTAFDPALLPVASRVGAVGIAPGEGRRSMV